MSIVKRADRQPMPAAASGATGTVAGTAGSAIGMAVVSSNPELMPFAFIINGAFTGLFTAIGNASRSAKQSEAPWKRFLGTCFGWIG